MYGVHNAYRLFVGKPERERSWEGEGRCRKEDNMRNRSRIECESVDWIYVVEDRENWWNL
jgi:hypothetical protein